MCAEQNLATVKIGRCELSFKVDTHEYCIELGKPGRNQKTAQIGRAHV